MKDKLFRVRITRLNPKEYRMSCGGTNKDCNLRELTAFLTSLGIDEYDIFDFVNTYVVINIKEYCNWFTNGE